MAHKFDRTGKDPYVEATHYVERDLFRERSGYQKGASEEIFGTLANAIVTSLGDIAAQAFRYGVSDPKQLEGMAHAIAAVSGTVFSTYLGEVDSQLALQALQSDPRIESLTAVARDQLEREIEKTRQIETLILDARRLPDLMDYAGSLGLRTEEDAIDNAPIILERSTPTTDTTVH